MAVRQTVLSLLLVVVVAAAVPATPNAEAATPLVALGVILPHAPEDPASIVDLTRKIGRTPAVVSWFQSWGDNPYAAAFQMDLLRTVVGRGAMPMITWQPFNPAYGANQPAYRLRAIAEGKFDRYVDSWAVGLARWQRPVYLRFAHEMNGDWYPWGASANGNTAADYVAAWRHVHRRFAIAGATNVRWVWAPNIHDGPYVPMERLYPGDAFVDWVGISGYNWGSGYYWAGCACSSQWRSFAYLFARSYEILVRMTKKPIMIAETASAEEGGSKAAWIRDAFQTQLPRRFPRVRAVIWFDIDKERDWRIDSSAASLRAFRQAVATPYLGGVLR